MNISFTTEPIKILVIMCPYCHSINTRPNDDKAWDECRYCGLTYQEAKEADKNEGYMRRDV